MSTAQSGIPASPAEKTPEEVIKKYGELYLLSKEVFSSEWDRFNRIDQKASWLLSALTIIIGLASLSGKMSLGRISRLDNLLEFSLALLGVSLLGCIAKAWYHLVQVLKLRPLQRPPLNEDLIKFFDENDRLIDIYFALSKRYTEFLPRNIASTDHKAAQLRKAYTLMECALVLLVLMALFYALSLI